MLNVLTYCKPLKLLTLALLLCASSVVLAEDTEIFSNEAVAADPNLLVILDNSGSMTTEIDGTTETRMQALGTAFEDFVNNPEVENINIGLMAFSNGDENPRPHGVSVPISPIDDEAGPIMLSNLISSAYSTGDNFGYFTAADDNLPDTTTGQTIREYLPEIVNTWSASGGTPIVDALHEAALYFRGETPKWGYASAEQVNAAHPSSYEGSILSEYQTQLTGGTRSCDGPTCGVNCELYTTTGQCSAGETSCYTGNNCTVETEDDWNRCDLGSISECMASNSEYSRCEAESDMDCTTSCSGGRDPETNACLGEETTSCTTDEYYECWIPTEYTSCDRERYRCDATEEVKVNSGSAIYTSPIKNVCESNTIIVMSDGSPNASASESETEAVRDEIKTLIGTTTDCADVAGQVVPVTGTNTLADGRCGPELAEFLATADQNSSIDGDNLIKTYTVGFAVDDRPEAKAYLESLASSGDGKYFSANNSAALAAAFMSILTDTTASSKSFAAPVYTVDSDSLISNSDDIYLPLFQNTDYPAWVGNIKKFKLNTAGEIVDRTGAAAFDTDGSLKPEAIDFWMPTGSIGSTDSDPIADGGFAGNVTPASRNILVDEGTSLTALASVTNLKTKLGDASMDDAALTSLTNFIKGYDEDGTTARLAIGDILHSEPTFISYGDDEKVLFFGTNEGFLHAIDAADATDGGGVEKFAFMPSSLLANVSDIKANVVQTTGLTRIYGVDGGMTAFITDTNNNGSVDASDGDTATLVFGLRRGGNEYYALDVTTPGSPSLKWKITGTGDFAKLGEAWSKPKAAKLRYIKSGTSVLANVLVFGGGYDNSLDEEDTALRASDAKGNAVFIVDLETGDLIWSTDLATGTKPTNSIPSDIRTLDMDDDGSIDRLYFGDTGGNIWRVDLDAFDNEAGKTAYDVKNNSQIVKFASLGGTTTDPRKFFFEPDVSVFNSAGQEALIVAIGSGYRAHPLNSNISDRFYVLSDENVRSVPSATASPLTDTDLEEASTLGDSSFFPDKKGWYMDLTMGTGEKVLASPLIFLSKITFTTFATGDTSTTTIDDNGCSVVGANIASAYVLDLMTAEATVDLDGDGDIDEDDMSVVVPNGNILDTPQLVFNEPSDCTSDGCNYFVDLRVGNLSTPLIDKDTAGADNDLGDYLPKIYWLSK